MTTEDAEERASTLVHRHGWNATAYQTLRPGFRYFFHGDACVAYVDTGYAWVAAGAPIASPDELAATADAFVAAARAERRRCCFFATEDRFREATASSLRSLVIGEQPVWDPRRWPDTLAKTSSLREQLRRARAKGVRVREVSASELTEGPLADAARALAERWLATRAMPPMGFVVSVDSFGFGEARRCFVAERDGRVVGLAHAIPVPLRDGWFVEHLMRDPSAPNGTVELVVDAVMRWAAERGSSWVTLGLAPLAGEVRRPLQIARKRLPFLYDFEGLARFKAKLRPERWTPISVSYAPSQTAIATIVDVLAAFASEGFFRFALRAIARGPSVVVAMLATLLVPWTTLVALASADVWFAGHAAVKWAWVVFDVLVLAGLVWQLERPSAKGCGVLATAITADAIATAIEAACWNVPRIRSALDVLVIAAACAAPALAAFVLWGARSRLRRLVP